MTTWRKSSRSESTTTQGNCVEVTWLRWGKSSRSGSSTTQTDCVEVARLRPAADEGSVSEGESAGPQPRSA